VPDVFIRKKILCNVLKYSRERMVSVQKVEDGAHWGAPFISILLSLLFTMVKLTILKTFCCGVIRLTVTTVRLGHDFHVSSTSDYNTIIVL